MRRLAYTLFGLAGLAPLAVGCSPGDPGSPGDDPAAAAQALGDGLVLQGKDTFENETFGSVHDVTCNTCHMSNTTFFGFGPQDVQDLLASDPTNPLFNGRNADNIASAHEVVTAADLPATPDYSQLIERGTVLIPFEFCPSSGVTIEPIFDGLPRLPHRLDALENGCQRVWLRRKTPVLLNVALQKELMHDGREGTDFQHQAGGAIQTHGGPETRAATTSELEGLEAFQGQLFSHLTARLFANDGTPYTLPLGRTPAQQRGRKFFVLSEDPDHKGPGGLCAQCHSSNPADGYLNGTSADNLLKPLLGGFPPDGFPRATNFSSEVDTVDALYRWTLTDLPVFDPFGNPVLDGNGNPVTETRVIDSPDPGTIVNLDPGGKPLGCRADPSVCIINPGSFRSVFRMPSIRYAGSMAKRGMRFFHHGLFDLDGMLLHYQAFFDFSAAGVELFTGVPRPDLRFSADDIADMKAYILGCLRVEPGCAPTDD